MSQNKDVENALKKIEEAMNAPKHKIKWRFVFMIQEDLLDNLKRESEETGLTCEALINLKLKASYVDKAKRKVA